MLEPGRFSKLIAAVALAGIGCTGQVSPDSGNGSNPTKPAVPGQPPGGGGSRRLAAAAVAVLAADGGGMQPAVPGQPGPSVFRRLTRTEYNNTIRDLLGDNSAPAKAFPDDQESAKSGFLAGGAVSHRGRQPPVRGQRGDGPEGGARGWRSCCPARRCRPRRPSRTPVRRTSSTSSASAPSAAR